LNEVVRRTTHRGASHARKRIYNGARGASHFERRDDHDGSCRAHWRSSDAAASVRCRLVERDVGADDPKALHEAYFANLGGDGRRSGAIETGLGEAYGSSSRWEEHFRATGSGLGGGSGWVMLSFELDTGSLRTAWSGHHTQALATDFPLLMMDMYEHSYQMDFGAAVPRYLDAFFANVQWDEVNARLERAQRLRAAL
jgi:Fe-Mn family superoxide dismutase